MCRRFRLVFNTFVVSCFASNLQFLRDPVLCAIFAANTRVVLSLSLSLSLTLSLSLSLPLLLSLPPYIIHDVTSLA